MDHMVHGPDGPGPFLFRSDIGDDALAPISVGRGPSMALPWAIPILLPAARHVIGAVARMPISDSWPVVQSCDGSRIRYRESDGRSPRLDPFGFKSPRLRGGEPSRQPANGIISQPCA